VGAARFRRSPATFPLGCGRGFRRVPWRFAGKGGAGLPRVTGAAVPMGPAPETAAALFPAV